MMKKDPASDNCHRGHRENVRRRFMMAGLDVFAPHEVLELLLYYAIPQKDTNPIAHRLLDKYGSFLNVMSSPVAELRTVEGVGERTAVFLSLVFQLSRWLRLERNQQQATDFSSAKAAVSYFRGLFDGERDEEIYQLCLNSTGRAVVCYSLSYGNIVSATMNMKTLIANAILNHCDRVIIAHKRPDGDARPSQDDYVAASRMKEAFDAVSVKLQDHIMIGRDDYASMREIGFLDN